MRITTSLWVSAYLRRTSAEGCYCGVVKRGAEEAGAIFVILNHVNGEFSLFAPAPQSVFSEGEISERVFSEVIARQSEDLVLERLQREKNFDQDLWIIENENRLGNPFLEMASE